MFLKKPNHPDSTSTLVSNNEIPFHCPPKGEKTWNMHPKVFLSFSEEGKSKCPYCGANYQLDK
ncbi:zinc-finger domain-containing protein [Candidatus Pseudothioglobus sp. Uisw_016]|uniref:zinc-finger domain-containing protein n=1 Tax=Candidatus Pseudothioglobus sp. Uisw_016 TaxID=3230995 RepID=UPI003A8B3C9D